MRRLRHTAARVRAVWPATQSLADFQRSLPTRRPAGGGVPDRRAAGRRRRARTSRTAADVTPWHSAMAATYAHATAPLRRLADRYVVEAALAVANGGPCPTRSRRRSTPCRRRWPRASSGPTASSAAVIDLAEAVLLSGREGEVFDAVVVDEDERGAVVQLVEPAVLARVARQPGRSRRRRPGQAGRRRSCASDDRVLTNRLILGRQRRRIFVGNIERGHDGRDDREERGDAPA